MSFTDESVVWGDLCAYIGGKHVTSWHSSYGNNMGGH